MDRMSDTTDMIEQMLDAPDAEGGDQFVGDGGVATLLIQETIEQEVVFDKYWTLPNHENSGNVGEGFYLTGCQEEVQCPLPAE